MNTFAGENQSPGPVLIVQDSTIFGERLAWKIRSTLGLEPWMAHSLAEAESHFDATEEPFFAAVVGLVLPDTPFGKSVELTLNKKVPTIVLTSTYREDIRDDLLGWNIVDFFLKDAQCFASVVRTLRRLLENPRTKILVVDDSRGFRGVIRRLLATHLFQVFEAEDGVEALKVLEEHPDVCLVISDCNMPNMDGFQLVEKVRSKHNREDLAIIGLTADGPESKNSVRMLKLGADDFLRKDFQREEFFTRVNRSIELIQHIRIIKEAACIDPLTRISNRQHFFVVAPQRADKRAHENCAVAIIDVDGFKSINDNHGQPAGDALLQHVTGIFRAKAPGESVLARLGGDEFCIWTPLPQGEALAKVVFEQIRLAAESSELVFDDEQVPFTVSIGCAVGKDLSVDKLLGEANRLIYMAQEQGGNQVVVETV